MQSVIKNEDKNHLIVISTPIGNLQEINERAILAIQENYYFLCEDTRTTKKLFNFLNINYSNKKFISYHKYNEKSRISEVLELLDNYNLVLLSDAGYPGISDPGYVVINECIKKNIFVEVINGASAFINALVLSGWSHLPVTFYGFIDWKKAESSLISSDNHILCFFESVHRIKESLKQMNKIFGDLDVFIGRELTKKNETHYFSTLSHINIPDDDLKGEFVILINNLKQKKYDLLDLRKSFIAFNDSFNNAKLKEKIKLFLEIKNIDNIGANELYSLLINNND